MSEWARKRVGGKASRREGGGHLASGVGEWAVGEVDMTDPLALIYGGYDESDATLDYQ